MSDKLEEQMVMQLQGESKFLISTHCKGRWILGGWNFYVLERILLLSMGRRVIIQLGKKARHLRGIKVNFYCITIQMEQVLIKS